MIQPSRILAAALAASLAVLVATPPAQAQAGSQREQRASKRKGNAEEQRPSLYPDATRKAPEAKPSPKLVKHLQALQELYEKDDMAGVIAKAEELVAMPSANAYERGFAYQIAAAAASSLDDDAKAADYFAKALATDGLDNDNHFNAMYNLAAIQFGAEKYADALVTIERFIAESGTKKNEHKSLRANILALLGRHEEAAAIYKDLIAANPDDKRILMNAVATLQGADKFDEANLLLEDAYRRGMLADAKELRVLYVGYMNAERWKDARTVIEDGLAKGILQPGPDLARDYQVLAQTAYGDGDDNLAAELYAKAAPMAADGEAYLNLAKVLEYIGKKSEAKAAAQKALDKGVKKPEEARIILSR